jgi:nucleoside-diphosphate-sugar epimerase
MAPSEELAIAPGSLVVVSGANGYIASHVVDQLLQAGYLVRGTVRNATKSAWLKDLFDGKYGPDKFSLFEVSDMAAPGAFEEAVKGASGLAHVATPVYKYNDPNVGIPLCINGALEALKAAATEPGLKRVVLTSSSTAASAPRPGKVFVMDESTWNHDAVQAAWAPPPYDNPSRYADVYGASKMQSEEAAWKWVRENKPHFVFNAILPNANFGRILSIEHQGYPSTASWIKAAWDGFTGDKGEATVGFAAQHFVDVQDDARVHVGALIYPDVKNERLFAFAYPYNWNDILHVLRKLYPDRQFIDDLSNMGEDKSIVSNKRAEELLRRYSGSGWTTLEESVKRNVEGLA